MITLSEGAHSESVSAQSPSDPSRIRSIAGTWVSARSDSQGNSSRNAVVARAGEMKRKAGCLKLHDEISLYVAQHGVTSCDVPTPTLPRALLIEGVEYLPAVAVAESLHISRQTFWRWRKSEKIPAGHRFRDGQLFFTAGELEEIRQFANRIEPVSSTDRHQLPLFPARKA